MADAGDLGPEDYNWFQTARRKVNDSYSLGVSQNQFSKDSLSNAYARSQGDLASKYALARPNLGTSYAKRGLLNSGIYQQGLVNFNTDQGKAYSDLASAYQDQLGGYDLARSQLEQTRAGATQDLADQEAARRAAVAASLRAAGL